MIQQVVRYRECSGERPKGDESDLVERVSLWLLSTYP